MNRDATDETVTLGKVFVAAGKPGITYNPRSKHRLHEQLRDYITSAKCVLLLLGPPRTGKTALLRSAVPDQELAYVDCTGVGADIHRFWARVISRLTPPPTAPVEPGHPATDLQTNAIAALTKARSVLVIDDFHLVEGAAQKAVIMALKHPMSRGVPIVLVGVPQRAHDIEGAVNLTSTRFQKIDLPPWEKDELSAICERGFAALNIRTSPDLVAHFCNNAYGSPCLVQKFCHRLCEKRGIFDRQETETRLSMVEGYENFFYEFVHTEVAADTLRIVSDYSSPRDGSSRTYALRVDFDSRGAVTIQQLVLLALRAKLPTRDIAALALTGTIADMIDADSPETEEVIAAVRQLERTAKQVAEELHLGGPAVEWNETTRILHIKDPSFAFYVKRGNI